MINKQAGAIDFDWSRLRVPLGSLAVDIALVIAVIYSAGQMTEKLEQIDRRVEAIESMKITPEADRRIAVVESRLDNLHEDVMQANNKLDQLLLRTRAAK